MLGLQLCQNNLFLRRSWGEGAEGAQLNYLMCSSQAYQATLELSGAGADGQGAEERTLICARARPAGDPQ